MTIAIDSLACTIAHWDAGAITGLVLDDPVSTLPDTKNGWDLTGTTTTRPLYKPSGINSLPSIQFDGVDDYMVTSATNSFSNDLLGSCFVIYLPARKNYSAFTVLDSVSGLPTYSSEWLLMGYSNGTVLNGRAANNEYEFRNGPSSASNALITSFITITNQTLNLNGASQSAVSSVTAGIRFNSSYYASFGRSSLAGSEFAGQLAEWVIFDQTSLDEHLWIEGILAHKYSLTLPVSHPFYSSPPTTGPSSGGVRIPNIRGGADQ